MRIARIGLALLLALAGAVASATERESRLQLSFRGEIPVAKEDGPPPKPLFLYVTCEDPTRDQERFEKVTLKNETFLLTAKFFDAVEIRESRAKDLDLLEGLRLHPPAVVAFDSTRKVRSVAQGRASAMKIYQTLVKVGQADWENDIPATVRAARNLLATFDQIDAARDALAIKAQRVAEARSEGNQRKAEQLDRQVKEEQAEIDEMYRGAQARWTEIWDLKRTERASDEEDD